MNKPCLPNLLVTVYGLVCTQDASFKKGSNPFIFLLCFSERDAGSELKLHQGLPVGAGAKLGTQLMRPATVPREKGEIGACNSQQDLQIPRNLLAEDAYLGFKWWRGRLVFSEIRKSKRSTYQLLGEEAAEQRNPQNRDQVVNKEAEVV